MKQKMITRYRINDLIKTGKVLRPTCGDAYIVRAVCLGFDKIIITEYPNAEGYKCYHEEFPCFILLTDINNNIYHYDLSDAQNILAICNDSHINEKYLTKLHRKEAKNYMCLKQETDALIRKNEENSEANKKFADELFGVVKL